MSGTEIWVEPVPERFRLDWLASATWAALERRVVDERVVAATVPVTADELTLTPMEFGAKIAAERGVPLVPLPSDMEWQRLADDSAWVLVDRGRSGGWCPTAPRPEPGAAPGYVWPPLRKAGAR